MAISAPEAIPVGSCNLHAAITGGAHLKVALPLAPEAVETIVSFACETGGNMSDVKDRCAQIFGAGDIDLLNLPKSA